MANLRVWGLEEQTIWVYSTAGPWISAKVSPQFPYLFYTPMPTLVSLVPHVPLMSVLPLRPSLITPICLLPRELSILTYERLCTLATGPPTPSVAIHRGVPHPA